LFFLLTLMFHLHSLLPPGNPLCHDRDAPAQSMDGGID